jgi:aminoglycoside phosphotransferase (APT) family kinase protein
MRALATTHDEDVPVFLRPLDGNSSDKVSLSATVKEVMKQLREELPEGQEQQIAVFDSGGYSETNVKSYNQVNMLWITRVPETSTAAKTALEEEYEQWQPLADGSRDSVGRSMDLSQGKERWIIVRPHARLHATKEQMDKKMPVLRALCRIVGHRSWPEPTSNNPSEQIICGSCCSDSSCTRHRRSSVRRSTTSCASCSLSMPLLN